MNKFDQPVVNLLPHFIGRDRAELTGGNFDGEIKRSFMAYIYDHRIRPSVANQKMGNFFDGLLGSRKPDAHWRLSSQRFQSFERQRQMGSALVICNRVNFINDDGLYITQNRAAAFGGQQNVE